jgi:DNA-binding PadR family transcriptional regulator
MVRRRPGRLLDLEHDVLTAAAARHRSGAADFHGYAMAALLQERSGARRLTGHGTLYKALARLERAGLLASTWEDPDTAAADDRPRRRLYRVTGLGLDVLRLADREEPLPDRVIDGLSPA